MADVSDVRRLALGISGVVEIPSDGFDFRVKNRGFVWSLPEWRGRKKTIRTDLAVLFVGDQEERQALLLGEPDLFMPVPGFGQRPFVVVRLASVTVARLRELISDACDMRRTEERDADRSSIA